MKMRILTLAAVLLASPAASALAADATKIGTYGDWTAYSYTEDGAKVCYMAASPSKSEGDYTQRGNVYAMITHRPSAKSTDVFSFLAGYEYKRDAPVKVSIDGAETVLLGAEEVAWTPNDATDKKLSEGLRKGKKMVITGTSSRGTDTTDTFSLKGTGSAYSAINKACGIN